MLGEMEVCSTYVVNATTLAPDLHIRALRVLCFTRPQPRFDLGRKLLMGDFGLSVKYGLQLDGDVVRQERHCQVCGGPDHFLHSSHEFRRRKYTERMAYQLLVVLHGHESRDGGRDVHYLRLLVRGRQCVVPLINELAGVGFLG